LPLAKYRPGTVKEKKNKIGTARKGEKENLKRKSKRNMGEDKRTRKVGKGTKQHMDIYIHGKKLTHHTKPSTYTLHTYIQCTAREGPGISCITKNEAPKDALRM
jgi:hypothetical protein